VAKHLVRRSIFRKRALFICVALFAGAVAPDAGHALNILTNGKVDWLFAHNSTVLFIGLSFSCFCGLVSILVWQRLDLRKEKLAGICQVRSMEKKMRNFFKAHRILAIGISIVLSLALVSVLAATAISNLWVSPSITVTVDNLPLVLSSPDFTAGRSIKVGVATEASVNLSNPSPAGAPGYTGVVVGFSIYDTDGVIVPSDILLEYQSGGNWYALPMTAGAGVITAVFGPSGGFPVGFGYNATTPLRATFNTVGTYHVTAQASTL
jgi:hypothetical protein